MQMLLASKTINQQNAANLYVMACSSSFSFIFGSITADLTNSVGKQKFKQLKICWMNILQKMVELGLLLVPNS